MLLTDWLLCEILIQTIEYPQDLCENDGENHLFVSICRHNIVSINVISFPIVSDQLVEQWTYL